MSSFRPSSPVPTAYSPEDITVLSAAYETICDAARLRDQSPIIRDLVASSVLEIASTGQRDRLRIVDGVMAKLGLSIRHAA
jgi:hypothetical protein